MTFRFFAISFESGSLMRADCSNLLKKVELDDFFGRLFAVDLFGVERGRCGKSHMNVPFYNSLSCKGMDKASYALVDWLTGRITVNSFFTTTTALDKWA